MAQGRDIIFFAGIEWYGQNRMPCHHLVERLAKEHRVFYVNNFGALRYLDHHDFKRCVDKVSGPFKAGNNPHVQSEPESSVTVWQPWVIPTPRGGVVGRINAQLLRRSITKLYRQYDIQDPIVWTRLPTPIVWEVIEQMEKSLFVYQSIDKFPEHPRISDELRHRYRISERRFNEAADIVFTSARGLWEEKREFNQNTHFIPNGVSEDFAARPAVTIAGMEGVTPPVVGFAGALGTATDNRLLAELAGNMPDVSFIFLGTIDRTESLCGLDELPNVYLKGLVPHAMLMSWFRYFDVGLMPYRINHFQDYTFPSKMAEYLMAGLPIVSTPLPEVKYYVEVVSIVQDAREMESAIRDYLAVDSRRDAIANAQRIEIAEALTWETQVTKIEALFADALR